MIDKHLILPLYAYTQSVIRYMHSHVDLKFNEDMWCVSLYIIICFAANLHSLINFSPYYRHVYDNFWLSNTLLMKDVTNNNWCPSAIHKVMDGSPHRRCWEISRDACCVRWIWCIYKGPWLQCVISEHPSQHSLSDHLELYEEWREWGWESFVAAFPWRDGLHGWWVCNCPIKISFNIKYHIPSVCKTFEVQLIVFLEMPLGLQEEACIGDIPLPWWSVKLNMKKKRPKYGGKRKQIDYSDINQYVNAKTWIWTWILKTLYKWGENIYIRIRIACVILHFLLNQWHCLQHSYRITMALQPVVPSQTTSYQNHYLFSLKYSY